MLRKTSVWIVLIAVSMAMAVSAGAGQTYRSPECAVVSADGKAVYVSDKTANSVVVVDAASGKATAEWAVGAEPTVMVLAADGKTLYVSLTGAQAVAAVNTANGKVAKTISVGHTPTGLALAPKANRLYVANRLENTVSMVDLATGAEKWRVAVIREPRFLAITPDESLVVAVNALPLGSAVESSTGCIVSLFDAKEGKTGTKVQLPGGSTNARGVAVTPDGKWAFVVHTVARFQVPTTQLERGWMNTSAMSVIDLTKRAYYATVLLDSVDLGAADPYGLAMTPDGKTLWASLSGTHEVARIDAERLLKMLSGDVPDKYARKLGSANMNPWLNIKNDKEGTKARHALVNDLMAMYFGELIERYPSGGKSPRLLALSADGKQLYVPNYYEGTLGVIDTEKPRRNTQIAVGPQPKADPVRFGEIVFHDATICFQHWQSCSSCHPDARMDGLRWDLLNDGMGNHKKTRNLVRSHQTSPVMAMGVRAKAEVGVRAGIRYILFAVRPEEEAQAIDAYLKSIEPSKSPYLTKDGKLTEAAQRGKAIFDGKAKCNTCHSGPLYTDQKPYDVGTLGPYDRKGNRFYTPKLIEMHRTAPYLHDGRSATLKDVLTTENKEDKHGVTSNLSEKELDDLIAYLKSL
jgi:YVTN family beta-propeller protein